MNTVTEDRVPSPVAATDSRTRGRRRRQALRADFLALKPTLLVVGALLAAAVVAVVVSLIVWSSPSAGDVAVSATDYHFAMETTLAAGHHTIAFTNNGKQAHEFLLFRTDVAANALPVDADGRVVEESPQLHNVVDSGNGLKVGGTQSLPVKLNPGHYVAVCNLTNHYKLGMYLDVTVK
jgi:plastocyanin